MFLHCKLKHLQRLFRSDCYVLATHRSILYYLYTVHVYLTLQLLIRSHNSRKMESIHHIYLFVR